MRYKVTGTEPAIVAFNSVLNTLVGKTVVFDAASATEAYFDVADTVPEATVQTEAARVGATVEVAKAPKPAA